MVSCSQPDPNQPDFLSTLPDDLLITILSFLPIHIAARTSILSRRFLHLWEASPSLNLTTLLCSKFVDIADRVLLHRNPSYPLLSLRLDYYASLVPDLYVLSLLAKAHSLGLRHLTVSGLDIKPILPSIFSINSLQSLSLSFPVVKSNFIFPSGSKLTSLRSLSVEVCAIYPIDELGRFIYELCSLEDLNLQIHANDTNILCSKSIRKLKLIMFGGRNVRLRTLWLLLPSLESLYLKTPRLLSSVFEVDADVPLLKNAVISLVDVHAEDVNAVTRLLNSISHVEELSLRVAELQSEKHLVPILLEPGKAVPNFHNLKRLDVHLCIHENSFEAVIIMVHNCPNLESLKLVHEIQKFTIIGRRQWKDGNSELYPYCRNFHLGENVKEFMKLLAKTSIYERHAQQNNGLV